MSAGVDVLVVEDDDAIRDGLVAALEDQGYTVQSASQASEALAAARVEPPSLAIIDVGLPGGVDGFSLARRLRDGFGTPFIFLTARGALGDRMAGFGAGADDYLVKPFEIAELLARVRVVLRRHGQHEATWSIAQLHVDQAGHTVRAGTRPVHLTATEFEMLVALMRNRGQVLSKTQLLASVHREDGYDPAVVESHMSSLRRKLRPEAEELIETVRGYGYTIR